MAEYHKRNPNTRCFICKKDIYKRPSEIKNNKGRVYCSRECYGISCRKEKPCIVCGTMVLAAANKKTCSRACANKNRTGMRYKMIGAITKDKVSSYKSLKIRLFSERTKVCEKCGYDKYEILQIHHKDRNRDNNDLDNLELICPNCHAEEHYLEKSWLSGRVI